MRLETGLGKTLKLLHGIIVRLRRREQITQVEISNLQREITFVYQVDLDLHFQRDGHWVEDRG